MLYVSDETVRQSETDVTVPVGWIKSDICRRAISNGGPHVHIIYMGDHTDTNGVSSVQSLHMNMLDEVTGSDAAQRLVHSYKRSFNGFAAWLSNEEMKMIANMDGVVSVFPSKLNKLHTTKSWDFMGFPLETARALPLESDIIIGMIDTGIWPESDSFNDEGFGPPPSRWKGTCQSPNFTCNNKIIGARYYRTNQTLNRGDILSARDSEGHGSHTASTVAGRTVAGANLFDLANGTARGGVPSARIAVYKACWSDGCSSADTLAAFDDAIADGVDIISISLGPDELVDYFREAIPIGSFHALKKGILTLESAGNDGPDLQTLGNHSPWSLTVAASTIDRRFVSKVRLGNGATYEGLAINQFGMNDTMYPLVYAGDVPNVSAGYNSSAASSCTKGSMDGKQVKGKVVLCSGLKDIDGPSHAGASGMIVITGEADTAYSFPLSAIVLGGTDATAAFRYYNTTSDSAATIMNTHVADDALAPSVASFSSRGPNPFTRDILKPDLTAPGVDILAAWSPLAPPGSLSYNIISGTSMSCSHATAVAAYVKSNHPDWSPAAIKSAMMTTAHPMHSSQNNNDTEFAYGAGHLNPLGASHPGLVYDAGVEDYVRALCAQGYNSTTLPIFTGGNSSCSSTASNASVWDLNYPSFALSVGSGKPFSASFSRTVTNVGLPNSTYQATITSPPQLVVRIEPSTFAFKSLMEKQSFTLRIEGVTTEAVLSASLELNDGAHRVRSPIVVYTLLEAKAKNSIV